LKNSLSLKRERKELYGEGTNFVNLLVKLSPVVVTVLTSTRYSPLNGGRVPGTNTGHLPQSTVGLARQSGNTPASNDTFVALTLGDTNGIDELWLTEDVGDGHGLLQETDREIDLVTDGAAVDLDLHDMGLLLPQIEFADLGVGNHAHDGAVSLDASNFAIEHFSFVGDHSFLVFGEGLLLGAVPVLVEAAEALSRQMLGPHGGESAHAVRGVNVAHNTDNDHGRGFEDGYSFNDFTLVHSRTRFVQIAHDVSHASFVGQEGCQMRGLGGIVSRESLDFSAMAGSSLPWGEAQGAMARGCKIEQPLVSYIAQLGRQLRTRELPVRHAGGGATMERKGKQKILQIQ